MAGYYREFSQSFCIATVPFTKLLRNKNHLIELQHVKKLWQGKGNFLSSPILTASNFDKQFKSYMDVNNTDAGAMLPQEDEWDVDYSISYFFRKFEESQKDILLLRRKLELYFWSLLPLKRFDIYLNTTAKPILVCTDHNLMVPINKMKENQGLLWWSLIFAAVQ